MDLGCYRGFRHRRGLPMRGQRTRTNARTRKGPRKSAATGKPYRGINRLLLSVVADALGFTSPFWLTFRQAKELGGSVRKGEKGQPCVFWRIFDGSTPASQEEETNDDDTAPSSRKRFVVRYYTVFNAAQCEGLPAEFTAVPAASSPTNPITTCESIPLMYANGPTIVHGVNRAAYSVALDRVMLPGAPAFDTPEDYYSTLFHELTHSTGHHERLGRFPKTGGGVIPPFGSPDYSREELVAELGAAFLCAEAKISCSVIENQAAYLNGWLAVLREDSKAIVIAAAQAQKAVDLILARSPSAEGDA